MTYQMKFFKESDFFDYSTMNSKLIEKLDMLREDVGTAIIITSSNDPAHGHATKSQHYLGNAVDVMFPKWTGKLHELIDSVNQCQFTGIGIYPHWVYNGKKLGGFHLDVRPTSLVARWIGVMENKKQKYVTWNDENLKKYKII